MLYPMNDRLPLALGAKVQPAESKAGFDKCGFCRGDRCGACSQLVGRAPPRVAWAGGMGITDADMKHEAAPKPPETIKINMPRKEPIRFRRYTPPSFVNDRELMDAIAGRPTPPPVGNPPPRWAPKVGDYVEHIDCGEHPELVGAMVVKIEGPFALVRCWESGVKKKDRKVVSVMLDALVEHVPF